MNKPTLTLIFLCLICSVGYAQRQVYVAITGRDAGDGSQANPYGTIRQAIAAAQEGDVIKIGAGVYHENVAVNKSNLQFEGEKDANGNWLTIVDGSTRISGWQKGFADGVYYHEQSVEPWTLVLEENDDTYDIAKLIDEGKNFDVYGRTDEKYNTQTIFRFDSNYVDRTIYMGPNDKGVAVNYWDGIGALYYYRDGATYLRFGDKRNPNDYTVRYANKPVFLIKDQSNVTIKDLKLRGGVSGVEINGSEARNNRVEGCNLINGQQRILIVNQASDNEIANNRMRMQGIANATGGAWAGGEGESKEAAYAIKEHIYDVYKYEVGVGTSSLNEDCGVDMVGEGGPSRYTSAGDDNRIHHNDIAESLCAVVLRKRGNPTNRTKIYNNTIHRMSSMAIYVFEGTFDTEVYDNEFYDVNFLSRLQELQEAPGRRVYFYRNRLWNEPGIGNSVFYAFYRNGQPVQENEIYIYHNSFAGGNRNASATGKNDINLKNWYMVNNIFSTGQGPRRISGMGRYTNNWCGFERQGWFGENNQIRPNDKVWPDATRPESYQLSPDDADAIGTALDLSEVKINNRILPGFGKGYYIGAPDMGAIEFGSDGTPTDPQPPYEPVPPVAAAYASVPPERANSLEASYWVGVTSYEFSDPTGNSDNRVAMKVVWNEQHLVIGVAVTDAELRAGTSYPWRGDAIDLMFDPTNQQESDWNPHTGSHRQVVVGVDRRQHSYPQGFGQASSPYLVEGEGGYYYEVRLPWTTLMDKLPQAGDKVGFDVANHDRDADGKTQFTYTQRTKEFLVPSQFTTLELRSPNAPTAETAKRTRQVGAEARQLTVYPNPAPTGSPRLRVSGFSEPAQVRIVNTQGQVVYWGTHDVSQIDLAQRFPRGLYVVHISDARGTLTRKLLVE